MPLLKKEQGAKRADDFSESPNSEKARIIDAYNYNLGVDSSAKDEKRAKGNVHPHQSSLLVRIVKGLFIAAQLLLFVLAGMLAYALIVGTSYLGSSMPYFVGLVLILVGMALVFSYGTFCVCTMDRKCTLIVLAVLLSVIAGQVFVMVNTLELSSAATDDRYTEYWDSLSNDKKVSFQDKANCCGFSNSTDRAGDPCPSGTAATTSCAAYIDRGLDYYHQNMVAIYCVTLGIEAVSLAATIVLVYVVKGHGAQRLSA